MDKNDQLFIALVMQYQQLAMMALGKLARPEGGMQSDLAEAALFIDMLSMLQEKTRGNLGDELGRMLDVTVSDLRLNYVDESRKPAAGDNGGQARKEEGA